MGIHPPRAARPGTGRRLPLAGIVGPVGFIAAWLAAGGVTSGYSAVDEAISRLAAVGAPARALMTAGFVCFGVAVPTYALALRHHLGGATWSAAAMSGAATLGLAAFPLGASAAIDGVHNSMAAVAYLSLVATPLLAARPLLRADHHRSAIASMAAAGLASAFLGASLLGPVHGLLQRAGLTLVDVWLIASAVGIIHRARPVSRPARTPGSGPQVGE